MLSRLLCGTMATVALISSNVAFAANKEYVHKIYASEIVGDYTCTGNDPTIIPSAFAGHIVITKKAKQYIMAETDYQGTIPYSYNQFGLRDGDELVMAFQQSNAFHVFGAQYMIIKPYGKDHKGILLEGSFSYWGVPDKIGTERCEKDNHSSSDNTQST